jgi:hypothetical protein
MSIPETRHSPIYQRIMRLPEICSGRLKELFDCPINCDLFDSPHTAPCGHTFEYSTICQSLERKKCCPLDQLPLQMEDLIPNVLVKEMVSSLAKTKTLVPIFLTFPGKNLYPHKCPITRKPLFEASRLPCGHIFDHSAITKWITKKGCCALNGCYSYHSVSEIIPDKSMRELVQKTYPQHLEEVKKINKKLTLEVLELQLDDRIFVAFQSRLSELIKCPLSNALMKNPIISSCGHTFDLDSIKDGQTLCPYNDHGLTKSSEVLKPIKSSVVINRLVRDVLEEMTMNLIDQEFLKEFEDKIGVFIFLDPTTSSLSRIGEIATILKLFKPPDKPTPNQKLKFVAPYPFFRVFTDVETPLWRIDELQMIYETTIPTLIMV